ncbi:hypothetical protein BDV24DRAFT_114568 [Aspergillus arachidicola]|uniref:Uncharacterized protein n=1 Tax=Aspergillus arachidicola TaxID=656916 RepID=A0A5N6YIA1_9EURO|nr:hypothetical protein BDV24DRAFT_114568 [Aspergillus arachidicola]
MGGGNGTLSRTSTQWQSKKFDLSLSGPPTRASDNESRDKNPRDERPRSIASSAGPNQRLHVPFSRRREPLRNQSMDGRRPSIPCSLSPDEGPPVATY